MALKLQCLFTQTFDDSLTEAILMKLVHFVCKWGLQKGDIVILYIELIKTLEKSSNLVFFWQIFCNLPQKMKLYCGLLPVQMDSHGRKRYTDILFILNILPVLYIVSTFSSVTSTPVVFSDLLTTVNLKLEN